MQLNGFRPSDNTAVTPTPSQPQRAHLLLYSTALDFVQSAAAQTNSVKMSSARLKFRKTHRRTSSLPFPPPALNDSGDSDDSDVSSLQTHNPPTITVTSQSISIDVAELEHSPTFNRRSVLSFNFEEPPATPITPSFNMSVMSSPLLSKRLHRANHSTSSTESLREDHRMNILKELIKTERRYISSLETITSLFLPSLEPMMAKGEVRLLFPCQLEPIILLHNDLLQCLEERIEGVSRWHGIIGDIFGRLCTDMEGEFIALYSAYMNDFKIAMETLNRYERTSQLFCKISGNCSQQPDSEGLSLAAHLLTPIQRIPRYELLLKELLKHTSADNPDCYYIEAALDKLHSTLVMLDRSIQACELASTIGQFHSKSKRSSNHKRKRRYNSARLAVRIKRHFSHSNINDIESSSNSSQENRGRGDLYRNSKISVLRKTPFAKSEFNLYEKSESSANEDSVSRTSFLNRATSVSDVMLLDPNDPVHIKPYQCSLDKDEEEERDKETTCTDKPFSLRSPSITSQDSIEITAPINIVDANRCSVYSSNSSASELDSLVGTDYSCGPDDSTATLKYSPRPSAHSKSSNDNTLTRKGQPKLACTNSIDSGYRGDKEESLHQSSSEKVKKRSSISEAFKVIRRHSKSEPTSSPLTSKKRCVSLVQIGKLHISEPLDFRHIQHGTDNQFKQYTSPVV